VIPCKRKRQLRIYMSIGGKVHEYTFRIRIIWKKNNSPKGTVARNETAVHMACQRIENYVKHSNSYFIEVKITRKKFLVKKKNIII